MSLSIIMASFTESKSNFQSLLQLELCSPIFQFVFLNIDMSQGQGTLSREWELRVWVCSPPTTGCPESRWKGRKEEETETSFPSCCCCCCLRSPLAMWILLVCDWRLPYPRSLKHWVCGLLGCTRRTTQCVQLPDISGNDAHSS